MIREGNQGTSRWWSRDGLYGKKKRGFITSLMWSSYYLIDLIDFITKLDYIVIHEVNSRARHILI